MRSVPTGAPVAERLVLDASVAVGLVEGERGSAAAVKRLREHVALSGELLVPEPFWLEVMNVLVRRFRRPLSDVLDAVQALDDLGIRTVPLDRPLTLLALDIAIRHGLSVHAAAYVAVAEVEEAILLTPDESMAAAVRAPSDTHSVREPAASQPAATWAAHGAYLAEVRART
jgi:predicted nucleic acid-binding protein